MPTLQPIGHTAYHHVGDVDVGQLVSYAGVGVGAFHGYRRNRGSVGWAIGWALLGGLFPLITGGIAIAQGLGKPKGG